MARPAAIGIKDIRGFIEELFAEDLHAKRVYSLANGTQGVMMSASLAVCSIGRGLALAQGKLNKHAIKQVDRLLSNRGIDVDELFMRWAPYCVGDRKSIEVAMDWTDFDADNQATIMLSLITAHGRATPGYPSIKIRLKTTATAMSTGSWSGWPKRCRPRSKC